MSAPKLIGWAAGARELRALRTRVEALERGEVTPLKVPATPDQLGQAMKAVRAALPILDDDLASYRSDTPPGLWDARGFVCLDDLSSTDHHRWKSCEATLTALAAIRNVLPTAEWEATTYAESQAAVAHFSGPQSAPVVP